MSSIKEVEFGVWLEDVLTHPINCRSLTNIIIKSLEFAEYFGWNNDPLYCCPSRLNCRLISLNRLCYRILENVENLHNVMETIADVRELLMSINDLYMSEVPQLAHFQ